MTAPNANDLIMRSGGGGPKSAKFDTLGVVVKGKIVEDPKVQQMRKFDEKTGKPSDELDYWPSGDPKYEVAVTLQTNERDPQDDEDDGIRILHVIPRMQPAVRAACEAVGAAGIAVGGTIAVQWSSGTGQGRGNPKQYTAEYQPPQVNVGGLLGNGTPATPAIGAPANADQARAVATTPQPAPPGIDAAKWATLTPDQQAAVIAAMPPF